MLTEEPFKIHSLTRQKLIGFLEHLSTEQLADIPYGFNNNIWWNIVHVLVTQQLLCYYLSGNDMLIEMHWVEKFKKGTKPNEALPMRYEIDEVKSLLVSTQQQLQTDYFASKFMDYQEYPSSYGYTMHTIEDAILFNNVHESIHLGTVLAMKKLV